MLTSVQRPRHVYLKWKISGVKSVNSLLLVNNDKWRGGCLVQPKKAAQLLLVSIFNLNLVIIKRPRLEITPIKSIKHQVKYLMVQSKKYKKNDEVNSFFKCLKT